MKDYLNQSEEKEIVLAIEVPKESAKFLIYRHNT